MPTANDFPFALCQGSFEVVVRFVSSKRLRLATVIHRSRHPGAIPSPGFEVDKRDLRLTFPDGWLETHPLTRADLEQEREYLEAVRALGERTDVWVASLEQVGRWWAERARILEFMV